MTSFDDPDTTAGAWYGLVARHRRAQMPHELDLPTRPTASIAAFVAMALADAQELLILVADDSVLPELSNALDLAIRPLCLVLPQADFAAGIALRATLSLLKSRLWRDGEEGRSPAWLAQRHRIATAQPVWQEAQSWLLAPTAENTVPTAFAALFPVLILPFAAWTGVPARPEAITLLYGCDAPPGLVVDAGALLRLGNAGPLSASRRLAQADETTPLLLERTRLTQDIADLELELASVQGELAEFMRDYYARVGGLMAEHDALQARLAARRAAGVPGDPDLQAAAEASRAQAEESAGESRRIADALPAEAPDFNPDRDTRQMFRRLAQQIHPDRAIDDADRAWRTQLMSEANRAYRHGDSQSLREIAALWKEQPETRRGGSNPGASLLRSQLQRLRARLTGIEGELHRLFGSQLYELFIAARQARRQQRDLLAEMASRLESAIEELRRSGA